MDSIQRPQSTPQTWHAPRSSAPSEHHPALPTDEQRAGEPTDRFDPSRNFKLLNDPDGGEKMGLSGCLSTLMESGGGFDGCLSTMMEGGNNPWCPGDHCGLDGSPRWPPYGR